MNYDERQPLSNANGGVVPRQRQVRQNYDEQQPHSNANASPFAANRYGGGGGGAPRGNGNDGTGFRGNRGGGQRPRGASGGSGSFGGGKGGGAGNRGQGYKGPGNAARANPNAPPRAERGEVNGNVAPPGEKRGHDDAED